MPDAHVDGRPIHLVNSIQLLIQRVDDPGGIRFNLQISSWMRVFDDIGFDVIDYIDFRYTLLRRKPTACGNGCRPWAALMISAQGTGYVHSRQR